MIRIRDGLPIREDIIGALESFSDTKYVESREEIHLHQCPLCGDTDNRGSGVQGAISYSLVKHCVTCAKCGQSEGWKVMLEKMKLEWEVERPGVVASLAERVRATSKGVRRDQREWVDQGDDGKFDLATVVEHAKRLMFPDSRVRKWLESRGFSFPTRYADEPASIWAGESTAGWMVLVYRNEDGSVRGLKYRNIDTKDFQAQTGAQKEPWGIHRLDRAKPSAVLTEGEIDAETLVQMFGAKNVLSLPNGANSWKEEWATRFFSHAEVVYVATDNDEHGDKVAAAVFESVPRLVPTVQRMVRVIFHGKNGQRWKDVNDAIVKGGAGAEEIRSAFENAEDPDVVSSERADRNTLGEFVPTTWTTYDTVMGGGMLMGEVTHLCGPAKSGKTTLVLDLHQRLALAGVKTGFVPLDMNTAKITIRIGMQMLGKSDADYYRTKVGSADRMGYDQMMGEALASIHKGRFLLSRQRRIPSYKAALALIERMGRSGCKVITVEDYLNLAVMFERESKGKVSFAGRHIVDDLADVAERCSCHIILINHLKDEKTTQAYSSQQIGAAAQANVYVRSERDASGQVKATIAHIRENRFNSIADVEIPFTMTEDRMLVAGPYRKSKGSLKKSKGASDGRDF